MENKKISMRLKSDSQVPFFNEYLEAKTRAKQVYPENNTNKLKKIGREPWPNGYVKRLAH